MLLLFAVVASFGNPTGGVVVNGDAIIQNAVPGLTTIVQSSDRAVIDWQSFSIQAGEHTNFIVPDATSATLNRVLGCDPSIINGSLTSNGHLFLINSNGIVFGHGATVDVAGLTASALNLDNCAFMTGGDLVFSGSSQAQVKNEGVITASSGDVFLIGYQVSNSGTVRAPNGTVGLAAGSEVLIKAVGDERVVVRTASGFRKKYGISNSGVIEASVAELKAHGGNVYALAIRNTGRVAATGATVQGGRIMLRADGGKIENSGTLVARGTAGRGGQISVQAGTGGQVTIDGRVDADGTTGAGGKVAIAGEKVEIRRAIAVTADGQTEGGQIDIVANEAGSSVTTIAGTVSASSSAGKGGEIRLGGNSLTIQSGAEIRADGQTGGGRVFAGGGWEVGATSVLDSNCVTVECGALLSANAIESGDGGKVVITSGSQLSFDGRVQARGGNTSGDGGFAELSAGDSVTIERLTGRVDLSAPQGSAGRLLLRSSEWEIADRCAWSSNANRLDDGDVSSFLDSANLAIQTVLKASGGNGNVVINGPMAWSAANALTITSACDFILLAGGSIESLGGGDVTLSAARSALVESGAGISTTTGNVVIRANQSTTPLPGDFNGITINGSISTQSGGITLAGRGGSTGAAIILDDASLRTQAGGVIALKTSGGAVTGNGALISSSLVMEGDGDFTLNGTGNQIGTVATAGVVRSVTLTNSTALTIGVVGTAEGLSAVGDIRVGTATQGLSILRNVTSQSGVIALSGGIITVNGATVSSTGSAPVTLTGSQFVLNQQPVIKGVLIGSGGNAQITLNDSNLTLGETYTLDAARITAGSRIYDFQNVSVINLELGAGDDSSNTNFFTFTQFLNAGGGTNKLFVNGSQPTTSPLTKPGFGTITFTGFAAPPVQASVRPDGTPFGSIVLQNAQPGTPGGSSGTQTNNFNSTSIAGAAGVGGAGGISAATGGLLANVAGAMGQNLGFASPGGGAPPSLNLQSQMNASTAPGVESELNAALGGDGTMGVRSGTGLVSVNPQGPPPSVATVAQLDAGMSLNALAELSFGVFGVSQVTVNSALGAQSLDVGGASPSLAMRGTLAQTASPESFSQLSTVLGGDGTARVEALAGTIGIDLRGLPVPFETQATLMSIISAGAVGELFLALGGTGESIVNDTHGLTRMDASGAAASSATAAAVLAQLAAPRMSQMSLITGGDGAGVMQPTDGTQSTALDAILPGPFVKARLTDATSQQSQEELDRATR